MNTQAYSYDKLIDDLSILCGILPEYYDVFNQKQIAPLKTKEAILKAMKINIDSIEEIIKEIDHRKQESVRNVIEPVYIISVNDQPITIPIYLPINEKDKAELELIWSIEDEKGQKQAFYLKGDSIFISEQLEIDAFYYLKLELSDNKCRELGYYNLYLECRHPDLIFPEGKNVFQKNSRLIITPDTCYIPPELKDGRTWGLSINLYSVRSKRNWGIGDFTDLKEIIKRVYHLGGNFVGINPLHALPNTEPYGISPYSPISRLFKNFIYLDIEKIPETIESNNIKKIIMSKNFKKEIEKLQNENLIDYEKIASLKEKILRMAFDYFFKRHYSRDSDRYKEFKRYTSEQGASLESFATFMALREHMLKKHNIYIWQEWPEEFQNPSSIAVQEFKKAYHKEILFQKYVQWLIDEQLKEVNEESNKLGMLVGLYNDIAIGSFGGGSDAWSYRDVIACEIDGGAPPDDFNPNGQNWGFPPMIPEKLKESRYELFIQTIRNNMKYSGALRIDHALGLFRLFWIPHSTPAKEGAYVNYPYKDLLRIIALESVRNKTIVIAEDLGTIGENVRGTLEKFHMLSYRLFYFERDYPKTTFTHPEKYPTLALCAVTTHDLPTIYGYWIGQDIKVKKSLGMCPDEKILQEQRERDKSLIISALKSKGIFPQDYSLETEMIPQMNHELCLAIYRYLSLTPCKLLLVSLDDIIGTINQQNMPGTVDQYPNWKQKIPLFLDELIKDRRIVDLSQMLGKIYNTTF